MDSGGCGVNVTGVGTGVATEVGVMMIAAAPSLVTFNRIVSESRAGSLTARISISPGWLSGKFAVATPALVTVSTSWIKPLSPCDRRKRTTVPSGTGRLLWSTITPVRTAIVSPSLERGAGVVFGVGVLAAPEAGVVAGWSRLSAMI